MLIPNEPVIAQHAQKVVLKTWGTEFWMVNNPKYCLKFLKVNPGFLSSIHAHKKKDETFIGIMGTTQLNIHLATGELFESHSIHPGEQYHIVPGLYHSFRALNVSWIMEISTQHDDKDVNRLQESRKT